LLDVRTVDELKKFKLAEVNSHGTTVPFIHIDVRDLKATPEECLAKVPKDKLIYSVCHAGVRGAAAA
jgi:rhodanese-related sulfurtransferase